MQGLEEAIVRLEETNSNSRRSTMEAENNYSADDDDSRRRSSKRSKSSGGKEKTLALDRISNLPNPLILHILSFLPTKLSARTSLLSKKWQHLWTSVPILDFDGPQSSNSDTLRRFVSFINHSLILNQSPKIDKFRVEMDYKKSFASDVDVWLRFAARKNVEELELNCSMVHSADYISSGEDSDDDDNNSYYVLPMNILSNISSLVTLKLEDCIIQRRGLVNWKSLKVLSLSQISLSNELISDILLGSPSLELLELLSCCNFDFLDIKSERLRKLVIKEISLGPGGATALRISAPNVQSLEISGFLNTDHISLINVSSLVDAKMVFRLRSGSQVVNGSLKHPKMLEELLQNLWHVKDLTVGGWCLQVLSGLEEKSLPCVLSCLVCLQVDTNLSKIDLPGITRLLALTPLLQTLIMNISSFTLHSMHFQKEILVPYDLVEENYWSSQKRFFMLALLSLKTVKIVNFVATENEIELILFLLKNASKLDKMIIHAQNTTYAGLQKCLVAAQRLLSFPRCSQDAVVLFM